MLPEVSHDDTKDIKRVRRVTIAVVGGEIIWTLLPQGRNKSYRVHFFVPKQPQVLSVKDLPT